MNTRKLSFLVFLILMLVSTLPSFSCIPGTNDSKPAKYDYSASIIHGGLERTFSVHVSSSYDQSIPTPLVIVLHGGGGTGQGMVKLTGFNAVADKENFVIVYPDGIEGHWNDGRGIQRYRTQIENIDDVGFISALIDRLSDKLNIDARRVYVTGISNGGMMSHRLGCELSQKIAAISPVAGNIQVSKASVWSPSRPLPVLIINGTDDPLVPGAGGDIHFGKTELGEVLSVADTVKFWASQDECSASPTITQLPDKDPSDGTTVRKEVYGGCQDGVEVVLYAIEGGGHTWPGGLQYLPESVIGKTSREFNAGEVIWQFFKEHPME
ncbi:MAG: phospholipase [Dehalococcoidia bacterium]|nr:phospholipase [Dehalococcoidia bacterium]